MAARSFEISQFSVSVNMSTFMAERMLAYSWLSSRPSQVTQLPWWEEVGKWGAGGCHRDHRLPQRGSALGHQALKGTQGARRPAFALPVLLSLIPKHPRAQGDVTSYSGPVTSRAHVCEPHSNARLCHRPCGLLET